MTAGSKIKGSKYLYQLYNVVLQLPSIPLVVIYFNHSRWLMERNTKYRKRKPVDQAELSSDCKWYTGAAGLLRYRREPGLTTNLATLHSGVLTSSVIQTPASGSIVLISLNCSSVQHRSWAEYPADCEYCGQNAKPLLDLSWQRWPEKALAFCCVQREQLYELLEVDRCMAAGRYATPQEAVIKDPAQFDMGWTCGFVYTEEPEEIVLEDVLLQPLAAESPSHALSFRLSRAPERCWTVYSRTVVEQHFKRKAKVKRPAGSSFHEPSKFGICDYQVASEFAQKNYSSGTRLLTAFSDGSAQLFYPSGSLAIAVMDTEDVGRVCIVYDDSSAPGEATRAIFHSDGRAKCYHSNRNLWLDLNKSVGRCLEQDGSRLRQWTWSGLGRVPTVLDPLHLNLNERVTLQILGREQVFISFQECGEEVKFSVGSCSC